MMEMNFRLFTLEEANALLVEVSGMLRQYNRRREDLKYAMVELEGLQAQQGPRHDVEAERRAEEKIAEINMMRAELGELHHKVHALGCVVRDYERQLVDFPAIVGTEPGYLCWRAPEKQIEYWHGPEEGFAGRKPLASSANG
jgi:hypothetical protein